MAAPEPEIAAKNIDASIATTHRPPLTKPSNESANCTIFSDTFPLAMISPARMKNGIATKGNESAPANIRCGTTKSDISLLERTTSTVKPMEIAIGTPKANRRKKEPNNKVIIPPPPFRRPYSIRP